MRLGVPIAVLFVGLLVSAPVGAAEPVSIGVMEFVAKTGIDQEKADVMADVLAEKVMRMGDVRVITKADFQSMLNLEKQKRMLGCDDKDCAAEIGGALGIRWMVVGNVGRFGKTYLLNLKLMDVMKVQVASRVSRKIKGDEDDLLDGLLEATTELFDMVADRLQLTPTVTVAARRTQPISESPSAVTVITRDQIRSSGAIEIVDILRRVPGFDVYELKPSYALMGARALTEESNNLVLVLVDGREELVELGGFPLMNSLSIDLGEVERIEVIRGPGSAMYGANAYAAVVSITTVADNPSNGGNAYVIAGEKGQHKLFARVRGFHELEVGELSFGLGLGANGRQSPSDRRYRILQIPYRSHGYLRYRESKKLDLSLHAGVVGGSGLFFTIVGDLHVPDALNYWIMGKADLSIGKTARLKTQLYYTSYKGTFTSRTNFRAYNIWVADMPEFPMVLPVFDGKVQLDLDLADNFRFNAGGNLRYITMDSKNYVPSELEEFRGAVFANASWNPADLVQFTLGLRLDLSTEVEPALSPRAAMVVRPWQAHSFRLSYGLAFRKPSLYESRAHVRIEDFNPAIPEIVGMLAEQIGNEALVNEKVHSIEAGWRGRLFDGRLLISTDIFFNIYKDTITFFVDLPLRMGLPDISNSTLQYQNVDSPIYAVGGEVEGTWRPALNWSFWCNVGLREVIEDEKRRLSEPRLRVNLGGRYVPESGMMVDVAFHYVTSYKMPLLDPENLLDEPRLVPLGNNLLLIGRLGYRMNFPENRMLEIGALVRTPIIDRFREYPGVPWPVLLSQDRVSDFGGEELVRLVSFYLRGAF
jgi:outer membrane receptor protein involved in Fe transport